MDKKDSLFGFNQSDVAPLYDMEPPPMTDAEPQQGNDDFADFASATNDNWSDFASINTQNTGETWSSFSSPSLTQQSNENLDGWGKFSPPPLSPGTENDTDHERCKAHPKTTEYTKQLLNAVETEDPSEEPVFGLFYKDDSSGEANANDNYDDFSNFENIYYQKDAMLSQKLSFSDAAIEETADNHTENSINRVEPQTKREDFQLFDDTNTVGGSMEHNIDQSSKAMDTSKVQSGEFFGEFKSVIQQNGDVNVPEYVASDDENVVMVDGMKDTQTAENNNDFGTHFPIDVSESFSNFETSRLSPNKTEIEVCIKQDDNDDSSPKETVCPKITDEDGTGYTGECNEEISSSNKLDDIKINNDSEDKSGSFNDFQDFNAFPLGNSSDFTEFSPVIIGGEAHENVTATASDSAVQTSSDIMEEYSVLGADSSDSSFANASHLENSNDILKDFTELETHNVLKDEFSSFASFDSGAAIKNELPSTIDITEHRALPRNNLEYENRDESHESTGYTQFESAIVEEDKPMIDTVIEQKDMDGKKSSDDMGSFDQDNDEMVHGDYGSINNEECNIHLADMGHEDAGDATTSLSNNKEQSKIVSEDINDLQANSEVTNDETTERSIESITPVDFAKFSSTNYYEHHTADESKDRDMGTEMPDEMDVKENKDMSNDFADFAMFSSTDDSSKTLTENTSKGEDTDDVKMNTQMNNVFPAGQDGYNKSDELSANDENERFHMAGEKVDDNEFVTQLNDTAVVNIDGNGEFADFEAFSTSGDKENLAITEETLEKHDDMSVAALPIVEKIKDDEFADFAGCSSTVHEEDYAKVEVDKLQTESNDVSEVSEKRNGEFADFSAFSSVESNKDDAKSNHLNEFGSFNSELNPPESFDDFGNFSSTSSDHTSTKSSENFGNFEQEKSDSESFGTFSIAQETDSFAKFSDAGDDNDWKMAVPDSPDTKQMSNQLLSTSLNTMSLCFPNMNTDEISNHRRLYELKSHLKNSCNPDDESSLWEVVRIKGDDEDHWLTMYFISDTFKSQLFGFSVDYQTILKGKNLRTSLEKSSTSLSPATSVGSLDIESQFGLLLPEPAAVMPLKNTLLAQSQVKSTLERIPSLSSLKKDSGSEPTSETASLDLDFFAGGSVAQDNTETTQATGTMDLLDLDISSFKPVPAKNADSSNQDDTEITDIKSISGQMSKVPVSKMLSNDSVISLSAISSNKDTSEGLCDTPIFGSFDVPTFESSGGSNNMDDFVSFKSASNFQPGSNESAFPIKSSVDSLPDNMSTQGFHDGSISKISEKNIIDQINALHGTSRKEESQDSSSVSISTSELFSFEKNQSEVTENKKVDGFTSSSDHLKSVEFSAFADFPTDYASNNAIDTPVRVDVEPNSVSDLNIGNHENEVKLSGVDVNPDSLGLSPFAKNTDGELSDFVTLDTSFGEFAQFDNADTTNVTSIQSDVTVKSESKDDFADFTSGSVDEAMLTTNYSSQLKANETTHDDFNAFSLISEGSKQSEEVQFADFTDVSDSTFDSFQGLAQETSVNAPASLPVPPPTNTSVVNPIDKYSAFSLMHEDAIIANDHNPALTTTDNSVEGSKSEPNISEPEVLNVEPALSLSSSFGEFDSVNKLPSIFNSASLEKSPANTTLSNDNFSTEHFSKTLSQETTTSFHIEDSFKTLTASSVENWTSSTFPTDQSNVKTDVVSPAEPPAIGFASFTSSINDNNTLNSCSTVSNDFGTFTESANDDFADFSSFTASNTDPAEFSTFQVESGSTQIQSSNENSITPTHPSEPPDMNFTFNQMVPEFHTASTNETMQKESLNKRPSINYQNDVPLEIPNDVPLEIPKPLEAESTSTSFSNVGKTETEFSEFNTFQDANEKNDFADFSSFSSSQSTFHDGTANENLTSTLPPPIPITLTPLNQSDKYAVFRGIDNEQTLRVQPPLNTLSEPADSTPNIKNNDAVLASDFHVGSNHVILPHTETKKSTIGDEFGAFANFQTVEATDQLVFHQPLHQQNQELTINQNEFQRVSVPGDPLPGVNQTHFQQQPHQQSQGPYANHVQSRQNEGSLVNSNLFQPFSAVQESTVNQGVLQQQHDLPFAINQGSALSGTHFQSSNDIKSNDISNFAEFGDFASGNMIQSTFNSSGNVFQNETVHTSANQHFMPATHSQEMNFNQYQNSQANMNAFSQSFPVAGPHQQHHQQFNPTNLQQFSQTFPNNQQFFQGQFLTVGNVSGHPHPQQMSFRAQGNPAFVQPPFVQPGFNMLRPRNSGPGPRARPKYQPGPGGKDPFAAFNLKSNTEQLSIKVGEKTFQKRKPKLNEISVKDKNSLL